MVADDQRAGDRLIIVRLQSYAVSIALLTLIDRRNRERLHGVGDSRILNIIDAEPRPIPLQARGNVVIADDAIRGLNGGFVLAYSSAPSGAHDQECANDDQNRANSSHSPASPNLCSRFHALR
jgi:hypothetical protein